jgi:hypothetical protein
MPEAIIREASLVETQGLLDAFIAQTRGLGSKIGVPVNDYLETGLRQVSDAADMRLPTRIREPYCRWAAHDDLPHKTSVMHKHVRDEAMGSECMHNVRGTNTARQTKDCAGAKRVQAPNCERWPS